MSFDTVEFLLFAAVYFSLWPLVRERHNARLLYIIILSLFFYAWGEPRYTPLLIANAAVDYHIAKGMWAHPERKKLLLFFSIAFNVGVLAFFKYLDFAILNLNALFEIAGATRRLPYLHLPLPLGISFYTFCSMSYTIDAYRGRVKPAQSLLHFMALITLFPHLVAGPIVRANHVLPQLSGWERPTPMKLWNGLRLIVYGFTKKLVIADQISRAVDGAFRNEVVNPSSVYWWAILALFFVQVYCDFSGYTDIARGLAKWMGYDFPVNFNHPFFVAGNTRLWQRWHISLFAWLRDYLFYPIVGKRPTDLRLRVGMFTTMVVSGIWHGANWTFIAWGFYQAAMLVIERDTKWVERLKRSFAGGAAVAGVITYLIQVNSIAFFRAQNIQQSLAIEKVIFHFNIGLADIISVLKDFTIELFLAALVLLRSAYFHGNFVRLNRMRRRIRVYTEPYELAILIAACVFLRGPGNAFIYFAF